jgi:thioredoxin 1
MKELLHFSATWCQPCKAMEPTITKFLEDNPKIAYTKYDADSDVETFAEYGITGVPAFVIRQDGEVKNTHKGVANAQKFASLFE